MTDLRKVLAQPDDDEPRRPDGHDGKPWPQTMDANAWATDIVIVLKIFATHFLFWFFIISMLDNFAC